MVGTPCAVGFSNCWPGRRLQTSLASSPIAMRPGKPSIITPSNTLAEARNIVKAVKGMVKDTEDTKRVLANRGWTVNGEPIPRNPCKSSSRPLPELKSYGGDGRRIPHHVESPRRYSTRGGHVHRRTPQTLHRLNDRKCVRRTGAPHQETETAESQVTIVQDMQRTQEEMAECARNTATQVRTYNQVAATPPAPPIHPPLPPITQTASTPATRGKYRN